MNATELRIGNIVFYNSENGKNEPVRYYCTINGADLRIMQDDENYLKSHEPIALTPEMLKKCLNYDKGHYTMNGLRGYFVALHLGGKMYAEFYIGQYSVCKVEYLHQLQNLYFALTGEELEINLEEK